LPGAALAAGIFLFVASVWKVRFFAVPLDAAFAGTFASGSSYMARQRFTPGSDLLSHLGWIAIGLAGAGLVLLVATRLRSAQHPVSWRLIALILALPVYMAILIAVTKAGLPTTTPRYHRYLVWIAHAFALLGGWSLAAPLRWLFSKRRAPAVGAVLIALWLLALRPGAGTPSGHWGLSFAPADYEAVAWIRDHTARSDVIVTHWFIADLVRSHAARATKPSPSLNPLFAAIARRAPELDLTPLIDTPAIRSFANERAPRGQSVYLLQAKWGPKIDPADRGALQPLVAFGANREVVIFRVVPSEVHVDR
jgi:hypothetical protein